MQILQILSCTDSNQIYSYASKLAFHPLQALTLLFSLLLLPPRLNQPLPPLMTYCTFKNMTGYAFLRIPPVLFYFNLHTYFISNFQLCLRQHEFLYYMKMIALYCIHQSTESSLKKKQQRTNISQHSSVMVKKFKLNLKEARPLLITIDEGTKPLERKRCREMNRL